RGAASPDERLPDAPAERPQPRVTRGDARKPIPERRPQRRYVGGTLQLGDRAEPAAAALNRLTHVRLHVLRKVARAHQRHMLSMELPAGEPRERGVDELLALPKLGMRAACVAPRLGQVAAKGRGDVLVRL